MKILLWLLFKGLPYLGTFVLGRLLPSFLPFRKAFVEPALKRCQQKFHHFWLRRIKDADTFRRYRDGMDEVAKKRN